MCEKTKYKIPNPRIDKCMREEVKEFNNAIKLLNPDLDNLKTVASCCGHKKYAKTLILRQKIDGDSEASYFDHYSGIYIPRSRNFYRRDKQGHYYIQEIHKEGR